jgi:hypothetical protein
MMLHSLAARALLMICEGCPSIEAVLWVCHRLPVTMQAYYQRQVIRLVAEVMA